MAERGERSVGGRVGRRGREGVDKREGVDENGKEGKAEEGNGRGEGRVVVSVGGTVVVGGSVESRRRNGGSGEGRDLAVDLSPEEGRSGGQRVQSGSRRAGSGEGQRGVDENPNLGVEGGVTQPRIRTPIRTMVTNE